MELDMEKTIVIFRMVRYPSLQFSKDYEDTELLAIFPEHEGAKRHLCGCYAHIGQHGDCDYQMIVRRSRPATAAERAGLERELTGLGYNLLVKQRISQLDYWANKEQTP